MFRFIFASLFVVFLSSSSFVVAQEMSKEQKKVWAKRQKSMPVEEFKRKIEGYETSSDEAGRLNRQFVSLSKSLAEKKQQIDSLEKILANSKQGKETSAKKEKSNAEVANSNIVDTENSNAETSFTEDESIADSNVTSSNSSLSDEDDYSKGTVYRVQVGAFRNKDLMKFVGHRRFHAEQDDDGVKKYTIAAFRDYWEADLFKKYMREMGVKDAWIVAYKDGVRVQIESVLSAENQEIVKSGDSKNSDVD